MKLQTLSEQWMSVKKVSCTRQELGIFIQFEFINYFVLCLRHFACCYAPVFLYLFDVWRGVSFARLSQQKAQKAPTRPVIENLCNLNLLNYFADAYQPDNHPLTCLQKTEKLNRKQLNWKAQGEKSGQNN